MDVPIFFWMAVLIVFDEVCYSILKHAQIDSLVKHGLSRIQGYFDYSFGELLAALSSLELAPLLSAKKPIVV